MRVAVERRNLAVQMGIVVLGVLSGLAVPAATWRGPVPAGTAFSFAPALDSATGSGPLGVAVGDVKTDGSPDVAVASQTCDDVSVLLGRVDGTFDAAPSVGAARLLATIAINHAPLGQKETGAATTELAAGDADAGNAWPDNAIAD